MLVDPGFFLHVHAKPRQLRYKYRLLFTGEHKAGRAHAVLDRIDCLTKRIASLIPSPCLASAWSHPSIQGDGGRCSCCSRVGALLRCRSRDAFFPETFIALVQEHLFRVLVLEGWSFLGNTMMRRLDGVHGCKPRASQSHGNVSGGGARAWNASMLLVILYRYLHSIYLFRRI